MAMRTTAVGLLATSGGCVVPGKLEFSEPTDYPPSIVSADGAELPLDRVVDFAINGVSDAGPAELSFQTLVRDPNVNQELKYKVFVDSATSQYVQGLLEPTGELERFLSFRVNINTVGCHRVQLLVSGDFKFEEVREPVVENDIDTATWWIRAFENDETVVDMALCL